MKGLNQANNFSRPVTAPDHTAAVDALMDWIEERGGNNALAAVGHRVVHGGPKYYKPQRITAEMVAELHRLSAFDPDHMPEEILLTEAFQRRFPDLPQVACFDTAFHHDLPRVAQMLPIPRRYEAQGVRRYGFHGLSYAFLMEELARLAGTEASQGRVILAHLGNGASLAAVHYGKSVDTSMSFTPTAGVPMSTRSGDLDPGLVWYLARTDKMSDKKFNEMVNFQSGLLGISETSIPTCVTCWNMKHRMCARLKRWPCSAIKSRNGSAHLRRRWADWTHSCSPAASERTRPRSAPGFVRGWDFSESKSKKNETQRIRMLFPGQVAGLRSASFARTKNS